MPACCLFRLITVYIVYAFSGAKGRGKRMQYDFGIIIMVPAWSTIATSLPQDVSKDRIDEHIFHWADCCVVVYLVHRKWSLLTWSFVQRTTLICPATELFWPNAQKSLIGCWAVTLGNRTLLGLGAWALLMVSFAHKSELSGSFRNCWACYFFANATN